MPDEKKKGSFREDIDDLLTRFGQNGQQERIDVRITREDKRRLLRPPDRGDIHDLLFEEAWRRS